MNTSSPCMHREKKCSGNRLASQVSRDDVFNTCYYNLIFSGVHALAQQEWTFPNNLVNAPFCPIPEILDILHVQKADNHILKRMVGLTMVPSSMQGNSMPTDKDTKQ
uniref:Uncharacterized protein n=1 Tax=Magallana gigas TaxID=29159 RepID=K1RCP7_MAGGI